MPAAILGTEDLDVSTILPVSVRLAGVAPIRSDYEDVATPVADGNECECTEEGPDGYMDLTLKFNKQEVVEALIRTHGELADREVVPVPLTGDISDYIVIEGADCVRIIGKMPKGLAAKLSDINGDGMVNMLDLCRLAQSWLESTK